MTTANDLIKRSMRMLGVYSIGEDPSPEEADAGLVALNALMGKLSNTPMVYAKTLDTIALSAGVPSIAVGPSGTTTTIRPIKVLDDSYVMNGNVTYPLFVFTEKQYSDILVKNTPAIPTAIWPLMNMPDMQLTFWPVPIGGLTLYLWSIKALQSFPALTTAVSLPPGWEAALAPLLAEQLGPEYDAEPSPTLKKLIADARRDIERMNMEIPMLKKGPDIQRGQYNILTNGTV